MFLPGICGLEISEANGALKRGRNVQVLPDYVVTNMIPSV